MLKHQYFDHLMWRADSFEKALMLGKIEGRRKGDDSGWGGWMASQTQWTWVWASSRSWWWIGKSDVLQSMRGKKLDMTKQLNSDDGKKESEIAQSCPTVCDPMYCSLLGSSVHGIFQARILEWVAISFYRRSSWLRDWTWVSLIVGRHFTMWATREWWWNILLKA